MKWWLTCMKKYVVFSGRARRKEYWMFYLFSMIFLIVAIVLDELLGTFVEDSRYGVISSLLALALILPNLAVMVRRLHDVGKSGWLLLIIIIPVIGNICIFILLVTNSDPGDNQYGPNPKMEKAQIQQDNKILELSQ